VKRKRTTVVLLLYAALVMAQGGCCLTNRLWSGVRDQPRGVVGAEITPEHVLRLAVRYESGKTRLVTTTLLPDGEWSRRDGILQAESAERLPPVLDGRIDTPRGIVAVSYTRHDDKNGTVSNTAWIDGQGYQTVVFLPAPLWERPLSVALAALATPVTLIVDLVTWPVYIAWLFFTAGGHGPCWLPWCNRDR